MNKFFLATVIVFGLTGSALAKHSTPDTQTVKVNKKGIAVNVPKGADVDVDIDGRDIEIEVDAPPGGIFLGLF